MRVFLSAVTSEFGAARSGVASDLRSRGIEVKVQEDFRQEAESDTTLAKLNNYIRAADAVVCVLGKRSGSVPPDAAAAPFAEMLPSGIRKASYTQWEFLFARHHGRRLSLYVASDEYNPDRAEATGTDYPELQAEFRRWLFEEEGLDRDTFANSDALGRLVLREEWPRRVVSGGPTLTLAETRERNDLLTLLHQVRDVWIRGLLANSVHGEVIVRLGLEHLDQANPWDRVLQLRGQQEWRLSAGHTIDDVFSESGRSLLILGEPGGGKTTTLLQLVESLVSAAEADPAESIPVVFNLSTWRRSDQVLQQWLVEELLTRYRVPRRAARRWLDANCLLPFLDGLDEVHGRLRGRCLEAIRAFVDNHGTAGIVVCSRTAEYLDARTPLDLGATIRIQPLTEHQVMDYLQRSGPALMGLGQALEQDTHLRALAATPLMLDIMSMAYRHTPAWEITASFAGSSEARRASLFEAYIEQAKTHSRKARSPDADRQTEGLLTWLARSMRARDLSIFALEDLDPSWLRGQANRVWYFATSRAVASLLLLAPLLPAIGAWHSVTMVAAIGAVGGFSAGLIAYLTAVTREAPDGDAVGFLGRWSWSAFLGAVVAAAFMSVGVNTWVEDELWFVAMIVAPSPLLLFSLKLGGRPLESEIGPVECLRWTRWSARAFRRVMAVVLLPGLLIVSASSYYAASNRYEDLVTFLPGRLLALDSLFLTGLLQIGGVLVLFASLAATIGGVVGGFAHRVHTGKLRVNEGTWRSVKNATIIALIVGVLGALALLGVHAAWSRVFPGEEMPSEYLVSMVALLTYVTWFAFMWNGFVDFVNHFVLRVVLSVRMGLPWALKPALDEGVSKVLLRRVGGSYIFIHRLLLEHLADRRSPPCRSDGPPQGRSIP